MDEVVEHRKISVSFITFFHILLVPFFIIVCMVVCLYAAV